jgi:hypothetical protein
MTRPTIPMVRQEFAIRCVLDAHDVLTHTDDVSPRNPLVNHVLNKLVMTLSEDYNASEQQAILSDSRVMAVRGELLDGLSRAESAMESHWSDAFAQKQDLGLEDLKSFWYWQNYKDLVTHEMGQIFPVAVAPGSRCAFVGGGPLPMTGILMALDYGVEVDCLDSDADACARAQALVDRLGISDRVHIVQAKGAEHDYAAYDYVLIASLVQDKAGVIAAMQNTGHAGVMGVRSAENLHTLLYEPFRDSDVANTQYQYASITPYVPDVINSTLFYTPDAASHGIVYVEERRQQYGPLPRAQIL